MPTIIINGTRKINEILLWLQLQGSNNRLHLKHRPKKMFARSVSD